MILALLILATANPLRESVHKSSVYSSELTSRRAIEERNENALAMILGEVRTSAADLMFIKTERYLHAGVAYKPHLNLDQMSRGGKIHTASCETGGVPTVIRDQPDDFRGFLGNLEREVKPWLDPKLPHKHGEGTELLPWYRVMTLADPHNVRGYMLGTMWLTRIKEYDQAVEFVREGIEKNPDNPLLFRLYFTYSHLLVKMERYGGALRAARKGLEYGKKVRPPLGKYGPSQREGIEWDDSLEEDFLFLARYVPLVLKKLNRETEALKAAREILPLAPTDSPLQHIIESLEEKVELDTPIGVPQEHELEPEHDHEHDHE